MAHSIIGAATAHARACIGPRVRWRRCRLTRTECTRLTIPYRITARRAQAAGRGLPLADDKVDRLGTLALLVRLDVEGDLLSLVQGLQPGLLDGGDVDEHIARAVVGFDAAVSAYG